MLGTLKMGSVQRPVSVFPAGLQAWPWLGLVMAVAIAYRLVFFTGYFGSDELTYTESAAKILAGDWRVSDYIGATRYGVNLPVALAMALFGSSEAAANLWALFCSLGEVALVFLIARRAWGLKAAVLAGLILASLPLHVHFAGRLMADAPLAFFLTLTLWLFLRAEASGRGGDYLLTGLAAGASFWVKESVLPVFVLAFLLHAAFRRQWRWQWHWMAAGCALPVAANCLWFWFLAGDPLYVVTVVRAAVGRFAGSETVHTSPAFYFHYLFLDLRHTWFLGPAATAALVLARRQADEPRPAEASALAWAMAMVLAFSFFVVSLAPLKFLLKQTNYLLIFAGPLAVLAGFGLSRLQGRWLAAAVAMLLAGSVVLAALEQQAIKVFTANSRAVIALLKDDPRVVVFGVENNGRAVSYYSLLEGRPDLAGRFFRLQDLEGGRTPAFPADARLLAVVDRETGTWSAQGIPAFLQEGIPPCWRPAGRLAPVIDGYGRYLARGLSQLGSLAPQGVASKLGALLAPVLAPKPGDVYEIAPTCRQPGVPGTAYQDGFQPSSARAA